VSGRGCVRVSKRHCHGCFHFDFYFIFLLGVFILLLHNCLFSRFRCVAPSGYTIILSMTFSSFTPCFYFTVHVCSIFLILHLHRLISFYLIVGDA
jgi:hypothetical protein